MLYSEKKLTLTGGVTILMSIKFRIHVPASTHAQLCLFVILCILSVFLIKLNTSGIIFTYLFFTFLRDLGNFTAESEGGSGAL